MFRIAACSILHQGVTIILDFTWTGWMRIRKLAQTSGIMYIRGEPVINPYVEAVDEILMDKNATDCALIFGTEKGNVGQQRNVKREKSVSGK